MLNVGGDVALLYLAQGEATGDGEPLRVGDSVLSSARIALAEGAAALLIRVTPAAG
jgi:hypothetical protein